MKKTAKITNLTYVFVAILLLFVAVFPVLYAARVSAQQLTERSMTVTSSNANDDMTAPDGTTYSSLPAGDPRNGAKVGHKYTFTVNSSTNVKAITFQYCDSPFGYISGCTLPDGFSAIAWNGGSATVELDDGGGTTSETWTAASTVAGFLSISKSDSALEFEPGDVITVTFTATTNDYFVNPSSDYLNQDGISSPQKATYFSHIRTHDTVSFDDEDDETLSETTVDDGTVASSVANSIGIYTRVQETLNFSVEGHTSADPSGPTPQNGASCSPLTRQGNMRMGDTNDALSTQQAYFAKSYFRLSTNSTNGTAVMYTGSTLSSGSHDIAAIGDASAEFSAPGEEQFGIAFDLTDNLTANVGSGSPLSPVTVYSNKDNGYAFNGTSPDEPKLLASSIGSVACDTGAIEYVANIAPDTPAGIYTTKITYLATPTY